MNTGDIYKEYSNELKGFLISKTGDKDLSEDILHETFVKVHLKISGLRANTRVRPWLYRILFNTLIDHYRKKAVYVKGDVIESDEEINPHTAINCLVPLINNLPEAYRNALILSDLTGLKQAEVAQKLNISLSGAKSRIQRGRKMLQEGYVDCCDYTLNDKGLLTGEGGTEEDCKVCV